MKRRYSITQIVGILNEAAKRCVAKVCRKHEVSDATYYNWKKKYGEMEKSDVVKLRMLEEENRKLKRIVADKELDIDVLKALLEKYGQAR